MTSACSPSSFSLQNSYWESILPHKSNHIILSFSISTLSLPPYILLTPSFSSLSPFSFPLVDSLPTPQKRASDGMSDGSEGVGRFPHSYGVIPSDQLETSGSKRQRRQGCFSVRLQHILSLRYLLYPESCPTGRPISWLQHLLLLGAVLPS